MGWDKAAEERTQQAAETLASMRDYEANQDAEAIRAALDEIERLADEEKAVDLYRKHFLRLTDWMGDRSKKVWRSGHDISERVIARAESAERDAQAQRERADRLEAALREARGFLPAKDSAYYLLSEELRRVIGEVDAALAAQPAQEQKQPAKCCDCPPGLRWAGQYGEGMCYCKCHEEGQR